MPVKKIKATSSASSRASAMPGKPRFLPPRPLQVETQTSVATTPTVALSVGMICAVLIGVAFIANMMTAAVKMTASSSDTLKYNIYDFAGVGFAGTVVNGSIRLDEWQTIRFPRINNVNRFSAAPVVIAKPVFSSLNSNTYALVNITDITQSSFRIKVSKWHSKERIDVPLSVSFLAVPQGSYEVNGLKIKAGYIQNLNDQWKTSIFNNGEVDFGKAIFSQNYNPNGGINQGSLITRNTFTPSSNDAFDFQDNNQCQDSDNGKFPNLAGNTYAKPSFSSDYCLDNGNLAAKCSGVNCQVNEFFCDDNQLKNEAISCSSGCINGACTVTSIKLATKRSLKSKEDLPNVNKNGYIVFDQDTFIGNLGNTATPVWIGKLKVNSGSKVVSMGANCATGLVVLADMSSANEKDPAVVTGKFPNRFSIKEEDSLVNNLRHGNEDINYLAICGELIDSTVQIKPEFLAVINDIVRNSDNQKLIDLNISKGNINFDKIVFKFESAINLKYNFFSTNIYKGNQLINATEQDAWECTASSGKYICELPISISAPSSVMINENESLSLKGSSTGEANESVQLTGIDFYSGTIKIDSGVNIVRSSAKFK